MGVKKVVEDTRTEQEKAWDTYNIFEKYSGFGEPTYSFNIGDKVLVGNLKNCVVDDIRTDSKGTICYGLIHDMMEYKSTRYIDHKNNDNLSKKVYSYFPWYDIRPITKTKDTNFTKDNDIDIRFYNTTIESLLKKYYLHGVNMNPEYQRDYVWTDKDKEALLDSIFSGIEIGKFAFIKKDITEDIAYEILDGKQRLSTLLDFYENRLAYKGCYFNELSDKDKYTFLQRDITYGETEELSKEQVYKYFYTLNTTGKVMDKKHLNKIKEMIDDLDNQEEEIIDR